jgi:hypothetical protein
MTNTIEDKGWLALQYLQETNEKHADLERDARMAEHRYKKTVDTLLLGLQGAIEQRKAAARVEAEPLYIDYLDAQARADNVRNKRMTAQTTIDYCRTIMANRRMG